MLHQKLVLGYDTSTQFVVGSDDTKVKVKCLHFKLLSETEMCK